MIANPGGLRVNWDRYLGHNIACIAVDGNGDIIDFDFNHNDFFRSSAEHAESRMVRRLFSLTDMFDGWKTGKKVSDKPHIASLNDVTLYTSLESCAQCSGVMSLAGVKQIVYMQNDFTAYKIGNLMYNLANRGPAFDSRGNAILDWQGNAAAEPARRPDPDRGVRHSAWRIQAAQRRQSAVLQEHHRRARRQQSERRVLRAGERQARFRSDSITSFLCTDAALDIFEDGGAKLDSLTLSPASRDWKFPNKPDNKDILDQPAMP